MSSITVEPRDGHIFLKGTIDFNTVLQCWKQCLAIAREHHEIKLDLNAISHSNSAGLALLLSLDRFSKKHGKMLTFLNLPQQMMALAKISGVDKILPIEG